MTADLSGEFDDLGDAAVGRPEHPAVQFGPVCFSKLASAL